MTQQAKQDKPKNLIPPSFSQAFLAGASSAILSWGIGVPFEYVPRVAAISAGYSLYRSLQDSRYLTAPRKRATRGRQIPINHGRGQSSINMEFSVAQGGYITRETWGQGLKRFVLGGSRPVTRPMQKVDRPKELDEFPFHSNGLQLREKHVKLFLASAWRNREYGRGLSARRWVRNFSQRPAWYRELSPAWYYAMMALLHNAEKYTHWQLIVRYDNSWLSLVDGDLRLTMCILKWYESERKKVQ
jgi:hypothetical protein